MIEETIRGNTVYASPGTDLAILATSGHHGGVGAEGDTGHVVEMSLLLKDIGL